MVDVPQSVGGHLQVVPERLGNIRRRLHGVEGREHVAEPAIPLVRSDRERRVAHPKCRVPSLLGVGWGTAPILSEEERQLAPSLRQVLGLWVEAQELRIMRDALVEPIDQFLEELHPSHSLEERDVSLHLPECTGDAPYPGAMISVRRFPDVESFLAIGGEFLTAREAEHNLILGLCSQLIADPTAYAEPPYLIAALEDERVVAIGLRTPPHNLVLSQIDAPAAIDAIARDAHDAFASLPGVLGPREDARAFTETWREVTGIGADRVMATRIYRASAARPPLGVPGLMRPYRSEDRGLVIEWLDAFISEALAKETVHETPDMLLARRIEDPDGDLLLWEDAGTPVSLAGFGNPTPNGTRVGPVYTPPALRGRGYASALVGQMTAMLLSRGFRFCFLFTDLANPTSNSIYQRVGYEPVSDVDQYAFG